MILDLFLLPKLFLFSLLAQCEMHILGPVIEPLMMSLLRSLHAGFGLKNSGLFWRRFAKFLLLACLHIRLCTVALHDFLWEFGDDHFGSLDPSRILAITKAFFEVLRQIGLRFV
jgi:hypothetical protein